MAESLWKACGLGFGTERALLQWRFDHEPVAMSLSPGLSTAALAARCLVLGRLGRQAPLI